LTQSRAAATVGTAITPRGNGGRPTMTTGTPRSRAAASLGAGPPLF